MFCRNVFRFHLAADLQTAALHLQKSADQTRQRGLAAAALARYAGMSARFNAQRQSVQYIPLAVL